MITTQQGTILTAESKPYNVNGNEGVSHKIRVLVDGQIFPCKSNAAQVAEFKPYEGVSGDVTLDLTSRKEALVIELSGFEPND